MDAARVPMPHASMHVYRRRSRAATNAAMPQLHDVCAAFAAMHKVVQQHPCSVYSVIEKLKEYAPSSTHEGLNGIHNRFLQCAEFDFSLVRCQSSPSHIHGPPPSTPSRNLPRRPRSPIVHTLRS